jgi:hypothetical protein
MMRIGMAFSLLMLVSANAEAGWIFKKHKPAEEVPGARPANLVTPNGVEVPAWASRRIRESPVPLASPMWGRRPWAFALSNQGTPSAFWARADQLGFGAGPVPGYTNGPAVAGNAPSMPMGPGATGYGWPQAGSSRGFAPIYPFNTSLTGY